jgi:hypothetical protein
MAFDVAAAKQAGYSDAEIAEYLGQQKKFDAAGAMKAGYSPAELIEFLGGAAPRKSTIGSELKRGAQQVASSAQTAFGAITGSPEEAAKAGLERGEAISQVAGEGASLEAVKRAYRDKGLLSAAGEAVSQIPRALAGQGANLATLAAGARLGAMAGSPLGPAGTIGGGVLGAGAAMLPQFFGSDVERQASAQMERGEPVKIDLAKAGVAAAGQSALEGAGAAFTLGKGVVKGILGITDDAAVTSARAAKQLEETARRSLTGTVARGAGRGAVVGMPVEVAQQVIERAQAGLDLTSPDALTEYGEAAYQAGLVGGPLGAAGNVVTRSQARDQVAARAEADTAGTEPPAAPEAPTEAPLQLGAAEPFIPRALPDGSVATTQAELDAYEEQKFKDRYAPQPVRAPEQMTLPGMEGLAPAEPTDLFGSPLARAEDTAAPRTSDLFEGVPLTTEVLRDAGMAPSAKDAVAAGQQPLGLRRTPEGKPTASGEPEPTITSADIMLTAIPVPKGVEGWLAKNVVGSTRTQLDALVAKDPTLVKGSTPRAKILRVLTAKDIPAFEEAPRVEPTPTPTPAVEQRAEPRAGEPSVGVPSEPAAPVAPEPGAGVPTTAGESVTPDGRGLVPAGRPAVPGAAPQRAEPAAVTPAKPPKPAPAEEEAPKAYEQSPAVVTMSRARTKAQLESALDEIARIRRNPAHAEHAAVNDFLTDALPAPGFEPMFTAALDRTRPRQAPTPPPAAPAEKEPTAGKATPVRAVPSAFFEPTGFDARTGAVKRGKQMLVQPIDDKRAAEYLKAKEQADEGDTSDLTALFEEIEREGEVPDTQGALFDAKGKVTKEAKVKAEPKARAKPEPVKAEPEPEPKAEVKAPAIAEWAAQYSVPGNTVVYADDEVALVRVINVLGGQFYQGQARSTAQTRVDIENYTGDLFTDAQKARLLDARAKAVFAESKRAAKNPDGPFTGAATNVVKSDSVDQRYADLLQDFTRSMGLGDVRIFLVHPEDMRSPGAQDKYKLYKSYETAQTAGFGAGEEGSTQPMGPDKRDFYISLKSGMSENKSIEVITHELGHIIELVAFKQAPADVQAAIKKEHENWLQTTKGKTGRELVQMLRNRETAETQMQSVPEEKTAEEMRAYWKSFGEWFADNTSRWASTADKPVTITEKFFSRVAQMMRDLVATVTGRKYPPNKKVAEFLEAMGPGSADLWLAKYVPVGAAAQKAQFSISPSVEAEIDAAGPMERQEKPMLRKVIDGFKTQTEPNYAVKFRTQVADSAATIEHRLREQFDGAVKDKLGKFNPMGLYRQAQDYSKMLLEYMQVGAIAKEPATGLWKVKADPKVRPPVEVYSLIDKWAAKNGYSRERATQLASRILEGVRLDAMRASNKNDGTNFLLHLDDAAIDGRVREYKADPDLQAMSKAMDESRIAMVDNMVKVGRLTAETGDAWKDSIGYVPFDRLEDENFSAAFSKIKKISNKGLAQLGKLPELVGSEQRPVGNVFDNYLNTLGWMVGQTLKTDGTVQTLRGLEAAGHANYLGPNNQKKPNAVGAYVKGEMRYWELPSKYDVLAFKDLNGVKPKWLQILGQASNVLRKSVTVLPPFALKQVTDDVQRAIMTSGVKNPGALLRMTLSNFGGLALAELRGIQHPTVKEFGALGLTGEYDFQQGKPATSVLKDLGYKPRGKFEALIHRLDGITRASDLAVRKAIYEQTLKEGGDQLLAQTRAREFINFRRRGSSDFVGAMVTTIPFFNAYIQGMDVLYRAASGKDSSSSVGRAQARRMFWSRAAMAMTFSTLYALGAGDDEDYQDMELRTRDSNWILPGIGKLSVPTELGALFKVIPERIVEYMRRQGTPEEQEAWEATRTALKYIMEQYVESVVPVPQAVKPLLEAWTNYSFFTGRELEGIYQKQQDPSMRRASNTSELAIAISAFSRDVVGVDKVSPILIDNALSGYFGSTAGLLVAMTDSLLNPTRVDRPLHKYALLSNYLYDPVGTRRMTEFYDEREKVGRANATLSELMKTDLDRAVEYAEKNADVLMMESAINSTLEQLERTRAYRKFLNSKDAASELSADEREAELKEIKQMEVELTGWVREAKTLIRQ